MKRQYRVTIWDINPEPWRAPGIQRYGPAMKDGKLEAYQEAIKEELEERGCSPRFDADVPLSVSFYFWRSTAHGQPCDTTNLQKATEDACEGLLYFNDKNNRHVQSYLIEQTPDIRPCIVIKFDVYEAPTHDDIDRDPPPETPTLFSGSDWVAPEGDDF